MNLQKNFGPIPSSGSKHLCLEFVKRCGLDKVSTPTRGEYEQLVQLRHRLRQHLQSRRTPSSSDISVLNDYLDRSTPIMELVVNRTGLQVTTRWNPSGWRAVMTIVTLSYASLLSDGGIDRIRLCANPDCGWLFYDDSRNRSRRWCDVAVCGNLLRVRRHRARAARRQAN
jgi:predicted RNA-binding Zn ribbon-like protein